MAALLLVMALMQGFMPPLRSLDKGTQSGISTARQATARDLDQWTALWRAHASDRPRPTVDLSREMVVGVFMGTRPTAGFAVEIQGYQEEGHEVIVRYRETSPARGALAAQMLTSPYHLVVIPTRAGEVKFEKIQ